MLAFLVPPSRRVDPAAFQTSADWLLAGFDSIPNSETPPQLLTTKHIAQPLELSLLLLLVIGTSPKKSCPLIYLIDTFLKINLTLYFMRLAIFINLIELEYRVYTHCDNIADFLGIIPFLESILSYRIQRPMKYFIVE